MLDLNGIKVWIADATTGEEHVPFEMQKISSNAITGTVAYSYRNVGHLYLLLLLHFV